MKIIHNPIFTFTLFSTAFTISMEAPPLPQLPADVIRYHIIPAVAETNTARVMETIYSINATNRFFHEAIQSEAVMLELLKRIPYTANAVYIGNCNKVARRHIENTNSSLYKWLSNSENSLKSAKEVYEAVESNNLQRLSELLSNKNVGLYGSTEFFGDEMNQENIQALRMLLSAGYHPDHIHTYALIAASTNSLPEAVMCLIAAGANPFIPLEQPEYDPKTNTVISVPMAPEIRQLILDAQTKRRHRLLELQGKAKKAEEQTSKT